MTAKIRLDCLRAEQFRIVRKPGIQCINQQRTQHTAQPIVRWDVEADLLPLKDGRWQLVLHDVFQKKLLARAANLQRCWQGSSEFDDAMVEVRGRTSTAWAMLM